MFLKFVLVLYTCVLYVFRLLFFCNIYTYYHIIINRNDKMYHTKNDRKKNITATQSSASHYITIHYNTIIYCYTLVGTRRHVTYSNVFQTSGRVGENCRFAVRDCRRTHNRTARARHRVQLQLFLSQRD